MDRLHSEYVEASRFLYNRINYEKTSDRPYNHQNYRLARMESLLNRLGCPQLAAPVVHVAGTKGKGSVCWQIAEMARRSGYRVGLYTSPHLEFLEERFAIDGVAASPAEFVQAVKFIQRALDDWDEEQFGVPTFFELTTAIAWLIFKEAKTQLNVIEVGMGGRLDSTNVCESLISVITPISFDHEEQLGNTITLIAGEKAGIIKPKSHVVCGASHPEARHVVRSAAMDNQCRLVMVGDDYKVQEIRFDQADRRVPLNGELAHMFSRPVYRFLAGDDLNERNVDLCECNVEAKTVPYAVKESVEKDFALRDKPVDSDASHLTSVRTSQADINLNGSRSPETCETSSYLRSIDEFVVKMRGRHQAENAGIAIAAAQTLNMLGWKISEEVIKETLSCTQVPSRIETVCESPMVILDSAHNVASMEALIDALKQEIKPRKLTFVFASSKDKDYSAMLDRMMPVANKLILTQFGTNPRHLQLESLEACVSEKRTRFPNLNVFSSSTIYDAAKFALERSEEDETICFTGSFFITTEVREALASLL